MTPVSVNDILDAIAASHAPKADPEGAQTTAEWQAQLGVTKRRMEIMVRWLLDAGRMERVTVKRTRIDGVVVTYPAYRLLPKQKVRA